MKEIFKRLSAETPKFFKRVAITGVSLAATGATISVIPNIPATLGHYAGQAIWVGAVMAAIAKMAVANPDQLK